MTRRDLAIGAVALFSLLAGIAAYPLLQGPTTLKPTPAKVDIPLQDIPLKELDGRETLFRDWQGELLIVNFWAPWCAPCRREIPALIEIQQEYAARGVKVLGLAFDGEYPVRKFAADYAITYPLFLVDQRGAMYNAVFGNRSGSLPFTALLDRDLKIRFSHNGEVSAQRLRLALDKIL